MWTFDVFDTCLTRTHAFPTDVFLDTASRLRDALRPKLGADYKEVFREARTEAEKTALLHNESEEVTLNQIWTQLIVIFPFLDSTSGIKAELAAEENSLIPIYGFAPLLKKARQLHQKAVYISDTYLPSVFLENQLRKHNLFEDGDVLFTSSDIGLTKRKGTIFEYCARKLEVPTTSLRHHGDNYHSDVVMAQRAGLNAVHLSDGLLSVRENTLGRLLRGIPDQKASLLIGRIRANRLTYREESCAATRAANSIVGDFIGPALTVIAEWVLRRSAADGIERLYFFSRDCHALQEVASAMAPRLGIEIECRYLKVSRQALLLPSISELSAAGVPWLRRGFEEPKFGYLCRKLDIDPVDACDAMRELVGKAGENYILASESDWALFWNLLNTEIVGRSVLENIALRRSAALSYFRQEGFFDSKKIGIVDLGWHQSVQSSLSQLLEFEGARKRIYGYYLALVNGRGKYLKDSPGQAIFHMPPPDRASALGREPLFGFIPLLEHVLNCAPHGTVHHYDDDSESGLIHPTTLSVLSSELTAKERLAAAVSEFAEKNAYPLNLTNRETQMALSRLFESAVESPSSDWTPILRGLRVAGDQNNQDETSLLQVPTAKEFFWDLVRCKGFSMSRKRDVWPQASLLAAPSYIRNGYRAIALFRRILARLR